MKFKIRSGYVIVIPADRYLDRFGTERERSPEVRHEAGAILDLTGDEADLHLHKLDAADKDAQRHLDSKVVKFAGPAAVTT